MPRKKIDLSLQPEYLSILNEHGELDKELEPAISSSELLSLYRTMILTREFDDRMLRLQRQGRLGTFPPVRGQEAAQVASVFPLLKEDWMVPSFRETGAMLHRGWSMEQILMYYSGYEEGAVPPEGVNDLPICVPVTSQLPHAVGLAWGARLKKSSAVTLCFLGDGATSEGDFHEALNFAAVFETPVVFVCQNNGWAISLPTKQQTRSRTLAQKAIAYEIPGLQVDGNDALAVYSASLEAVKRAREGGGPTFIEALTYRLSVHTTADDPKRYRTDEEVSDWEKRDPIVRFQQYLQDKGVLDQDDHDALVQDVLQEIRVSVERAETLRKPEPLDMFDYTYKEPHSTLLDQRKELDTLLKTSGADKALTTASH